MPVPSHTRALTKSRSKSTPGVKVNTRRCLGEEMLSASVTKKRRRLGEGVARSNSTKARQSQCSSPIPMGRKDHGGSDVVGRPQVPITRGSDKEKEKVASRP